MWYVLFAFIWILLVDCAGMLADWFASAALEQWEGAERGFWWEGGGGGEEDEVRVGGCGERW